MRHIIGHQSENKGYCGIFFQPYSELCPSEIRIKNKISYYLCSFIFVAYNEIVIFVTFRQDPFVACAVSKHFLDQWRQFLR